MARSTVNPAWKELILSRLNKNIEQQGMSATYVALATVTRDNKPANRTVVFRGFAGQDHKEETGWESDLLVITCTKRSRKMDQIQANSMAEISWFMNGTQEQFRVNGRLHALTNSGFLSNDSASCLSQEHIQRKNELSVSNKDGKSLATRAFLAALKGSSSSFDWEAERLRQWYRMSDELRATFVDSEKKRLEIQEMDDSTGWFKHEDPNTQALLEQAYENFVVLFLEVHHVDYLHLITGEHVLYHKSGEKRRL